MIRLDTCARCAIVDIMNTITINTEGMRYEDLAVLVRIRDRHLCQIKHFLPQRKTQCRDNTLEVHHITPKEEGGTNDPDNLILLCRKHHHLMRGTRERDTMIKLRGIIIEWGIVQGEMAGYLGVSQSAISQTLNSQNCSIVKARKIQQFLKTRTGQTFSIDELFSLVPFRARKKYK